MVKRLKLCLPLNKYFNLDCMVCIFSMNIPSVLFNQSPDYTAGERVLCFHFLCFFLRPYVCRAICHVFTTPYLDMKEKESEREQDLGNVVAANAH